MAIEIVRCKNCINRATPCCGMRNVYVKSENDYCSNGEKKDAAFSEYVYSAHEVDRHIKVNLRLINKFKEQLYDEYGKELSDIWKMYETLYQEQIKEMPLLWYQYGFGSAEND